jgi:hypothetical protein
MNEIIEIESQTTEILKYLQSGKSITPIEALNLFHCFRLGARISDLRNKGYIISTEMIKVGKKRFGKYTLIQ